MRENWKMKIIYDLECQFLNCLMFILNLIFGMEDILPSIRKMTLSLL